MSNDQFDYLVIGAGSAGNVLARRLIDSGASVALLEAGGDDTNPNIKHLNTLGLLWHSENDWDYYTIPQPGANNRRLHIPRGKVMGGSHALNASIWVRGDKWDYDTWAELGCQGWSWDEVLPVFKSIENFDRGASALHGDSGLQDVVQDFEHAPIQQAMLDGALETGIPFNPDYNSGDVEGVAWMQLTIRDGLRYNTWHSYLKPVADAENLGIITNARVTRLLMDGTRATGAEYLHEGEIKSIAATETILCAGALNSPEILLRSGIGPASELEALGIEVTHDLPGVGKNLHDHLLSPVILTSGVGPIEIGPVAPAEVHFFTKSRPDLPVPDTQPILFSVPMYSQQVVPEMIGPDNGFSLLGGLVRPASRGELTLKSSDPADGLNVDIAALAEQQDLDALVFSVKQCREIGRSQAVAKFKPTEIYPGPEVSDDELEEYVRNTVVTYHHQVGTCKMGVDDAAVTDPTTLRVHGVQGVRVADASVMPLVTTGNTNAPAILIGEKAAGMVLGG
ncbi:GMC family oxidoreductase [Glutamicibacter sp. X7]